MSDKNEEIKGEGFVIRDKRSSAKEGEKEEPAGKTKSEEEKEESEEKTKQEDKEQFLPEIDFAGFIFSLSSSALIHLGEIPDPMTKQTSKNLSLAKQTIDILSLLEEKTKGNLTKDEDGLMENLLSDLKMKYLKAVKYI